MSRAWAADSAKLATPPRARGDPRDWSDGAESRIYLALGDAHDKATGHIVHAIDVPAILTGTPMTYVAGGKQYIVAAYGAGPTTGLVALALP